MHGATINVVYGLFRLDFVLRTVGSVCGIPVVRYGGKLANKSRGGVDYRAGNGD